MDPHELLMAAGVIPFLFVGGHIGKIVFVNGIVTHLLCACKNPLSKHAIRVDVITNVLFCLIVNMLTPFQPLTFLLTFLSALVWIRNKKVRRSWVSVCLHVVLVQWLLCFLLKVFIYHVPNPIKLFF